MLREGTAPAGFRIRSLPYQNGVDFEYVVLLLRNAACLVRPGAVQLSGSTCCRAAYRFLRPGDGALPCGFQLGRTAGPRRTIVCAVFTLEPSSTRRRSDRGRALAPVFPKRVRSGDLSAFLPGIVVTPSRETTARYLAGRLYCQNLGADSALPPPPPQDMEEEGPTISSRLAHRRAGPANGAG